jgi:streptomycin 6-kinase
MKNVISKWNLTGIKKLKEQKSPHTKNEIFSALKLNDQPVILKHIHSPQEYGHEKVWLEYFDGNASVKLLDYDDKEQILLLEKIEPGKKLSSLFPQEDIKATKIAATLIKQLHKKPLELSEQKSFPTINMWLAKLHNFHDSQIPENLLKEAQELSHQLLETQGEKFLLHGDLHHENILQKSKSWIAIDPKGVIGDLAYECGAYLRNPVPDLLHQQNPQQIIKERISIFSKELDIPSERILQWSFVQAVLAAIWALEDKSDFLDCFIKVAKLHQSL